MYRSTHLLAYRAPCYCHRPLRSWYHQHWETAAGSGDKRQKGSKGFGRKRPTTASGASGAAGYGGSGSSSSSSHQYYDYNQGFANAWWEKYAKASASSSSAGSSAGWSHASGSSSSSSGDSGGSSAGYQYGSSGAYGSRATGGSYSSYSRGSSYSGSYGAGGGAFSGGGSGLATPQMQEHLRVLGLLGAAGSSGAASASSGGGLSAASLKASFHRLAIEWHPDKHTGEGAKAAAESKFKRVQEAYNALRAVVTK